MNKTEPSAIRAVEAHESDEYKAQIESAKIDTTDNVKKLLHLQIGGNVPIPGLEEENLLLKQEIL